MSYLIFYGIRQIEIFNSANSLLATEEKNVSIIHEVIRSV